MAIAITDLTSTDNMDSAKKPALTDLREHTTSLQTYINDSIKDNLLQLAKDCFPTAAYTFDSDGSKNFTTHDLFDKQTASDTYTGGDITIATVGAWTDVNATDASITFTPDLLAGDFNACFMFNVEVVTTNATNEANVWFRITDSTTSSDQIAKLHLVTGVITTTNTVPVMIFHPFDSLSALAKTIKLQYYINTTTATTIKVLANSNSPIVMKIEKI